MMRRLIVCGIALLVGTSAGTVALRGFDEKTVLVSVAATETGPARALKASDFKIQEEKNAVEVSGADLATEPMSIVVVVDTTQPAGIVPPTQDIRKALSTFVATVLGTASDSQIALYQVANAATPVTEFTSSKAELDKGIALIVSGSNTAGVMLEGVLAASARLGEKPPPRRAIVCISFGTAEAGNLQPKKVAEELVKSGATLWVVSVETSTDTGATTREQVWGQVTVASGGMRKSTVGVSGLEAQMKSVANSLLSQYTLTLARKGGGGVKPLKGQTSAGAQVLFTRWMR
jgi:hypothetical protein